jgi:tripartite-type tricarboxylate transporter receptor subunit TctC
MAMPGLPKLLRVAAASCAGALFIQFPAAAQTDGARDYPGRPVRFIVPFAPGAGTDTTARTIAQKLSDTWGQQVVVDNRTGAAGAIGVDLTAKAIPDGYTICLISASHSVNSAVNPKLPYDLLKDLAPVSQASSLFYVVYHNPLVPVKSIKELVAYAKANPGKLNFGSSGTGGLQHFAGELFNHMAGVRLIHVPYKGTAAVIPAMLAGDVQVGFGTLFGVRPHLPSGRLRALAVTTTKRTPAAPELPTVAEAGVPGYQVDQWYGVLTSAKVPAPIVRKLNAAINEALKAPDVAKRFTADGSTPTGSTPEQFGAHIRSEIAKWSKLVKEAKLELQQ